ncbi:plasmid replication initiation protein, partial [Escherichia coli]
MEDARKKLNREARRPRRGRFSIGSAPLTSITESDAQISGSETRQDYKDPRRFPLVAPS